MARHGENIYMRKDGRYEGRYVVGRTASGRTRFGYVYGRQFQEVRQRLLQKKAEQIALAGGEGACRVTLAEWMERWLSGDVFFSVKPSTYQAYRRAVQRHLLPGLGGCRLTDLSPELVAEFVAELEGRLARSTVKGVYRLLSSAMRAAQEEGLVRRNPCRRVRFSAPQEAGEQRVLSRGEQAAFRDAACGETGVSSLLALYTGMRLGEICALRWSDIDWERRTVTIRRTAQRIARQSGAKGERTLILIGTPKSLRSRRVLPLADFLLPPLRALLENRTGEYVFGGARAADPCTIQRRMERIARLAGLAGVHFHTLRHSFATRLFEMGVDVKTVSALLGHSSARITLDFYAHSLPEQQRFAVERLAAC